MTPSPRWRKILRDLFQNRARTIMTMVSITVGVLAIGFTGMSQKVLDKGMAVTYQSANPSQITFVTSPFQSNVTTAVRALSGVAGAETRTTLNALINTQTTDGHPNPDSWQDFIITAMSEFSHQSMDKIAPGGGQLPEQPGELALDDTSLLYLNLHVGQAVWVKTPGGPVHRVKVTGTVHDTEKISSHFSETSYGYIVMDALPNLGIPRAFNTLSVQVRGDRLNQSHIEAVAHTVRNALRSQHVEVTSTLIPPPGKHWAYEIVHSMTSVLTMIGVLDAVLGACLVFNTVLASLTGQIRQIGIMKLFGASVGELIRLYLGYVSIICVVAISIGTLFAMLTTKLVTSFSITLMGISSHGFGFTLPVVLKMLVVGLFIPMAASLLPILSGARISVREAISGVESPNGENSSRFDLALERVKGLPRVLVLALRNTFRRKGRLTLTVFTLGLGGAVVMGTLTVQNSLDTSVNRSMAYSKYDLRVTFDHPEPTEAVSRIAKAVGGVTNVQGWAMAVGNIVRSDGSESGDISLLAAPPNSNYVQPDIVRGRWLYNADSNAIVLDTYLLHTEPKLHVGQSLTLDVNGRMSTFHVVGLLKKVAGEVDMYVMPSYLQRLTGQSTTTSVLNVRTTPTDETSVKHIAAQLSSALSSQGHTVTSVQTTIGLRNTEESKFSVVMSFLKLMSILISIVAGLGLMGSQTLNVLERTREIGVLRSIGASTPTIWSIVAQEGLFIGFLGWVLASLLSIPVSHMLSDTIGQSLFLASLNYGYQYWSLPVWFGISLAISALSSILPARNATRLTVRDVLAHDG